MTQEQKRIKIAEACGWRITETIKYSWVVISPLNMEVAWSSQGGEMNDKPSSFYLPNYLNDLDAMHEAEKVLTKDQRDMLYPRHLGAYTQPTEVIYATASQRARAFLETLGLWDNGSA